MKLREVSPPKTYLRQVVHPNINRISQQPQPMSFSAVALGVTTATTEVVTCGYSGYSPPSRAPRVRPSFCSGSEATAIGSTPSWFRRAKAAAPNGRRHLVRRVLRSARRNSRGGLSSQVGRRRTADVRRSIDVRSTFDRRWVPRGLVTSGAQPCTAADAGCRQLDRGASSPAAPGSCGAPPRRDSPRAGQPGAPPCAAGRQPGAPAARPRRELAGP